MNLSFDDWQKRVDAKGAERAQEHRPVLKMLAQAEVKAGLLTGDPNWDIFLSYVQADVEFMEGLRDGFEAKIADPRTVNHEQIVLAKIGLAECTATINAWEAVISLPKDILEMGREARTLLDRMPPPPDAAT